MFSRPARARKAFCVAYYQLAQGGDRLRAVVDAQGQVAVVTATVATFRTHHQQRRRLPAPAIAAGLLPRGQGVATAAV
jgi:hypothetical protein